MVEIYPKHIDRAIIYRMPIYVLFPLSLVFHAGDYSLYLASGHNIDIYSDASTRMGMSADFQPLIAAFLIGSSMLLLAAGALALNAVKDKRMDAAGFKWIMLGLLSHPLVIRLLFNIILIR